MTEPPHPQYQEAKPLDGWVLYITNHFTHPLREAQTASPRFHLARKMSEKGQKLIIFCPLGRHLGSPLKDLLANLRPKRTVVGNTTFLFPPILYSPASATTVASLVFASMFILAYLWLTRTRIAAQYSTTMLVSSVGAVVKSVLGIPLVANYGDPDFAREHGLSRRAFGFCEKLVMSKRNAHAVVFVDENIGSYVRDRFHVERLFFLPNGGYEAGFVPPAPDSAVVAEMRERLGLAGKRVVLYAGLVSKNYRLDLLVPAAMMLVKDNPDLVFAIIGEGSALGGMKREVRAAGLSDHFLFVGTVPYSEIGPFVAMSEICLQLLEDMCMGTKVLMYMSHAKPVVSSGAWFGRYGGFLRGGENILLVEPRVEPLADALRRLLEDPDLERKIGLGGWTAVKPYTWDAHAAETLRLLDEAASSLRQPR